MSWEKNPGMIKDKQKWYSENDLIDAYLSGKKAQRKEDEKVFMEIFSKNLDSAKNLSESFFKYLLKEKIDSKFVSLRPGGITQFDAIFVVAEDDFISTKFEEIYKMAIKTCSEVESNTFNLSFSFLPYSKNVNRNKLHVDGYVLTYGN